MHWNFGTILSTERGNCMKKFDESAANADSIPLEFPDWSGMDDSTERVSAGAAFELCEQYTAWVQSPRHEDAREKCLEFVL